MILWLCSKNGIPSATRALLLTALKAHGVNSTDIIFTSLLLKTPSLGEYKKRQLPKPHQIEAALHVLNEHCKTLKPTLIVINDEPTLRAITKVPYSLSQVRSSVYDYNGIPCLVLDKLTKLWQDKKQSQNIHTEELDEKSSIGRARKWVYGLDIAKLVRYATGRTKSEPPFNFTVAKSFLDVYEHVRAAKAAEFIAEDIETRNGFITCLSFTYNHGKILNTFCVPFFDPYNEDGAYWLDEQEEIAVRVELASLNASPIPKCFQNGMYDCAYLIEEGMPPQNYILDTQGLMHALWCEAPKKLHNIASYFCDNYTYWKDESKGVKEDGFGRSHADVDRYWRYNGLDTYYTWLSCRELLRVFVKQPWAVRNYNTTISLSVGPCLAQSLRGLNVSRSRHAQIMRTEAEKAELGKQDLRELTGEADFNPGSTRDVAWFLYDVLGAKPTRLQKRKNSKYGPRSTDEKVLKLIKEQRNAVVNNFIDRLLEAKKPAANISKYGNLYRLCRNGRFLSWSSPTATVTGRFNSTKSQFWTGTNAQNIPDAMQELIVADEGYVFVKFDYGASDDRFIAYEAEDPDKIATVEDRTKDIHCKHTAFFFGFPYEKVYEAYKARDPWAIHATKGVRQISKKATHGRNYDEEAETMYNAMGRDMVVAAAIALGHTRAAGYSDLQLIQICQFLIDKYDHPVKGLYRRLRPWKSEIAKACITSNGLVTAAGGFTRRFFGDPSKDHKVKRELAAQYGQGGTAGNINRALRKIWYEGIDDASKCLYLLQVHDSLLFAIHRDHLHRFVNPIREIMQLPITIHGRTFSVPTDPKVGLTLSETMMDYKPDTTYEEIEAFEQEHFGEKYKKEADIDLQAILGEFGVSLEDDDETDDEIPVLDRGEDAQSGEVEEASL